MDGIVVGSFIHAVCNYVKWFALLIICFVHECEHSFEGTESHSCYREDISGVSWCLDSIQTPIPQPPSTWFQLLHPVRGCWEMRVCVCVCVFKKVWILIPHVIADRNCIFSYSLIVILVQWLLFLRSKWATWNFPADLTPWHSLPFQLSHPLPPCDKYSFSKPD